VCWNGCVVCCHADTHTVGWGPRVCCAVSAVCSTVTVLCGKSLELGDQMLSCPDRTSGFCAYWVGLLLCLYCLLVVRGLRYSHGLCAGGFQGCLACILPGPQTMRGATGTPYLSAVSGCVLSFYLPLLFHPSPSSLRHFLVIIWCLCVTVTRVCDLIFCTTPLPDLPAGIGSGLQDVTCCKVVCM
jgi:hypothetical protein